MRLTMAQKKSVIVLSRQMDRLDFTTPKRVSMQITNWSAPLMIILTRKESMNIIILLKPPVQLNKFI